MDFLFSSILFAFLLFLYMLYKMGERSKAASQLKSCPQGHGNYLYWKYASACWLSSSPIPESLVQAIRASHEPSTWPPLLASNVLSYDSTDIVYPPYGDYWRQLRNICVVELLTSKRAKSFQLVRKRSFQISLQRAAFGEKFEDQDAFISVTKEMAELYSGFCVADMYPSVKWLDLISGMRYKLDKIVGCEKLEYLTSKTSPKVTDTSNAKWYTENLKVKGWLLTSMSSKIMKQYLRLPTAHEIWTALAKAFYDGANESQLFALNQ
ncbi:Amorpha-4,11-diene 12-monooxygenase [Vitis vinifera]|uniref:Amorpha-4,11-diene 12-monooxygenase n=1 Tax=Vitis vinifera TaxID=29760 RepID=A0A438J7A5_VITVI|nr:Amorpha-4,11-diene 12-monooxygenase [Vitis vinifera]